MDWQYNTEIKLNGEIYPLRYNIIDREADVLFKGVIYKFNINPRTPFDSILFELSDIAIDKY